MRIPFRDNDVTIIQTIPFLIDAHAPSATTNEMFVEKDLSRAVSSYRFLTSRLDVEEYYIMRDTKNEL